MRTYFYIMLGLLIGIGFAVVTAGSIITDAWHASTIAH